MILLTCLAVRRHLPAFHDGELTIDNQIAVQAHLRGCSRCAAEARRLQEIGEKLREGAPAWRIESDDLAGLAATVVSRLKAEEAESLPSRFGRMFEDLHLVWAALGATGATTACIALIVGIFSFCTAAYRPDSMAALISALANPGSNANPVRLDGQMALPRPYDNDVFPAAMENQEESVYTLAAVLSRDGRITNLELIEAVTAATDRQAVLDLLDSLSTARFEPARYRGSPVAVNMVWMLAHLTVRAKPEQPRPATISDNHPGRGVWA